MSITFNQLIISHSFNGRYLLSLFLTLYTLFMTFTLYGHLHLFKKWPGLPNWACSASSW